MGAGIKAKFSPDLKSATVTMKLHFWNRNYVSTHYGGSLYSMCDPYYMILLMENLGPEYIVWDKGASIEFKNPGKGRVTAYFTISEEKYNELREQVELEGKINPVLSVDVVDENGLVVVSVNKIMHIRKKN